MRIERALKTDAEEITEVTIRSKNHWNYGAKQIEAWREELTVSPAYIIENQVYKLVSDGKIIGFYAYQPESQTTVKLNFLFIDPSYIGKGYGKLLMDDFLQRIDKKVYEKVTLDADPNAEKFYHQFGFQVVGKLKSSIKDRFLPIMELQMKPTH